jgi:hypothetical protein
MIQTVNPAGGGGWAVAQAPSPPSAAGGGSAEGPRGVACTPDGACAVVGDYIAESGVARPFAEMF